MSDYRGQGRDEPRPARPWVAAARQPFLQTVAADGFTGGAITLELDCRRYLDDRAALIGYLDQERQKCLALLDGEDPEDVLGRPDVVSEAPSGSRRATPTSPRSTSAAEAPARRAGPWSRAAWDTRTMVPA